MPMRNSQNPIKASNFGQGGSHLDDPANIHGKPKSGVAHCPSCKAEVPPKPGFRFSALKCPKCGASMSKK